MKNASIYYSDEDIPVAKKDRAKFNTFKKAINDEKNPYEKREYMKPFEEFEAKGERYQRSCKIRRHCYR